MPASVFSKAAFRRIGILGAGSSAFCFRRPERRLAASEHPERPVLRFGAIADVQYADIPDGWNFQRTHRRGYRSALVCLRNAVKEWVGVPQLSFVVDLGDIIDQQCESEGQSHEALARVLKEWEPLSVPVHRLVGNHELYNFSRAEAAELIPGITPWYRSFKPARGWRIVVLDPYDLNVIEKGGGVDVECGFSYLGRHNPNDLRAPRGSIDLAKGLSGLSRRFLPMGGGVGEAQLLWLARELELASKAGERVVVCTHLPILVDAAAAGAIAWNYDEVLEIVRTTGKDVVALVLAGHLHSGGYALDAETGTHHVTLPSPLHATDDGDEKDSLKAHCIVELWDDRVEILGRGLVPSRTLCIPSNGSVAAGSLDVSLHSTM
eukprot:TRINITY_DN56488_c0_g1_i1.p1 TRINITY_DN56488_c0_g1~~TRINITY_DN56488_c0_g1_i1.p1  ORF type:complete len:378 (+),score=30.97 TRINITY_DN56488_c0_g1_i1:78-1211(+)